MNMDKKRIIENLFVSEKHNNLSELVSRLQSLLYENLQTSDAIATDLVNSEFIDEIRNLICQTDVVLYFGSSLRELKCVVTDESNYREHTIFIRYEGPKKLFVTDASVPHSNLLNKEYQSIKDIVNTFGEHINSLSSYFYELERIDRFCTVMEPAKASFRDDYRRILLDDRTWLHVEVTPKGFAANIHLLGHSELWHDKLQAGLINWDHDKDIVENITTVFDIINFPVQEKTPKAMEADSSEEIVCSICLCPELADAPGVPLPLCQNPQCVSQKLLVSVAGCVLRRPPASIRSGEWELSYLLTTDYMQRKG